MLQLTAAGVGYLLGSGLFGELCLEYRLKNAVPLLLEGSNVKLDISGGDGIVCNGLADGLYAVSFSGELHNERAVNRCEQLLVGELIKLCANLVTQGHLEDTLCNAAVRNAPYGNSHLVLDELFNGAENFLNAVEYRQAVFVVLRRDVAYLMTRSLEFSRDNIGSLSGGYCEGNQRRRNVDMLEGTAHAVLAADCAAAHLKLCTVSAEQRCERLAPSLGFALGALEIFLECQPAVFVCAARCDNLCDTFNYRAYCSVIRGLCGYSRVEAPCHYRSRVGLCVQHRELRSHCLYRGLLGFSGERH